MVRFSQKNVHPWQPVDGGEACEASNGLPPNISSQFCHMSYVLGNEGYAGIRPGSP